MKNNKFIDWYYNNIKIITIMECNISVIIHFIIWQVLDKSFPGKFYGSMLMASFALTVDPLLYYYLHKINSKIEKRSIYNKIDNVFR